MKKLLILLTLISLPAWAAPTGEQQALASAGSFLKLVDARQYPKAYLSFSKFAQKAATQETFINAMRTVQGQIGNQTSRKVLAKNFVHEIPGAPKGDYWIIDYDTNFSKKGPSVERVTTMLEGKSWKIGGYLLIK